MKFKIVREGHDDVEFETPFNVSAKSEHLNSLARQISKNDLGPGWESFTHVHGDEEELARLKEEKRLRDEDHILALAEEIKAARAGGPA